jgi:hypothetical protein
MRPRFDDEVPNPLKEIHMSKQAEAAVPFGKMSLVQKCVFVGKATIFVLSFGFAYSHIFTEV